MSSKEFVLQILHVGVDYAKIIVPALIALHMPQPSYMKKKEDQEAEK